MTETHFLVLLGLGIALIVLQLVLLLRKAKFETPSEPHRLSRRPVGLSQTGVV